MSLNPANSIHDGCQGALQVRSCHPSTNLYLVWSLRKLTRTLEIVLLLKRLLHSRIILWAWLEQRYYRPWLRLAALLLWIVLHHWNDRR